MKIIKRSENASFIYQINNRTDGVFMGKKTISTPHIPVNIISADMVFNSVQKFVNKQTHAGELMKKQGLHPAMLWPHNHGFCVNTLYANRLRAFTLVTRADHTKPQKVCDLFAALCNMRRIIEENHLTEQVLEIYRNSRTLNGMTLKKFEKMLENIFKEKKFENMKIIIVDIIPGCI